jgi:hypothetical protein
MAFPVVESSTQVAGSPTITAPSGIQVGDLLLFFVGYKDVGATREMGTVAGFTTLHKTGDSGEGVGCFYKIAVLADTTATAYSLGFDFVPALLGVSMHRISGVGNTTGIRASDFKVTDSNTGTATTPIYASSMTPLTDDSLVVVMFMGASNNIGSVQTLADYAITPSATLTERADVGEESGSDGVTMGVATGNYSGLAPITSRTATFSTNQMTDDQNSIAILINGTQSATTDVSHLDSLPTVHGLVGTNNVAADVPHLAVEPTINGLSSKKTPTPWRNQDKPNTNWNNLPK